MDHTKQETWKYVAYQAHEAREHVECNACEAGWYVRHEARETLEHVGQKVHKT